jgi:hypothetical protein
VLRSVTYAPAGASSVEGGSIIEFNGTPFDPTVTASASASSGGGTNAAATAQVGMSFSFYVLDQRVLSRLISQHSEAFHLVGYLLATLTSPPSP